MKKVNRSLLLIVSAPSGAGKTTLCRRLLVKRERMRYSVSCTTRTPREGEIDGESYHFLSENEFNERIQKNEFLEYARVHGAWYGTLRATVEKILDSGDDIVMDIDVQGAAQIREYVSNLPEDNPLRTGYVDVFVVPPSLDELRARLDARAKDSAEVIDRRMQQAESEIKHWNKYKYYLVNADLDVAVAVFDAIVTAEHHLVGLSERLGVNSRRSL